MLEESISHRKKCYRCYWPKSLCWCSSVTPIDTQTKIVILMHPKEFKYEKSATGRLTNICLNNSEIYMGVGFDEHTAVQRLMHDPRYFPVLLYPCEGAMNISKGGLLPEMLGGRQLLVFLLDATWYLARKMFNLSPSLQKIPRLMFIPEQKSRFLIKKQPHDVCLSTIEATHELLRALEKAGLDTYHRPKQLLDLFDKMQQYQIAAMSDPSRQHYRRGECKHLAARAQRKIQNTLPAHETTMSS